MMSGVVPRLSVSFAFAPFLSRRLARLAFLAWTAEWSRRRDIAEERMRREGGTGREREGGGRGEGERGGLEEREGGR